MSVTSRYTIHPPQLVGRISVPRAGEDDVRKVIQRFVGEWDGSMQELQRFLKYLMDTSDQTQQNVVNVDNSVTNVTNVVGGLQTSGARPMPHVHGQQDVDGLLLDHAKLHLHRHPHAHRAEDVIGVSAGASFDILAVDVFAHRPHTHEGADLINALTVENVGTPGSPLSLGDFILASQIFGP